MTLVNTLQGHEGEVTCVRWNIHGKGSWVTGSEDGTIRIWVSVLINNINVVIITVCLFICPVVHQRSMNKVYLSPWPKPAYTSPTECF